MSQHKKVYGICENKCLVPLELDEVVTQYVNEGNFNDFWEKGKLTCWYVNQSSGKTFSNEPHSGNLFLLSMSYGDRDCVQMAVTRNGDGRISVRRMNNDGSWHNLIHHFGMEYDSETNTLNFLMLGGY